MLYQTRRAVMENILKKILIRSVLLLSILIVIAILTGSMIASLVLGMLLNVAWWKLALVILATVIITKLFD